jgi:5'-deoxynucleotidase YfbR-like HD superfamily hydrolase
VMALLLAEYAGEAVDLLRVLKMVLLHDIVEIDAGDTFVYDVEAVATRREREERAAERIFGLLPPDQRDEFRAIWEEFEAQETAEARFAGALDRLQPLLHNYHTQGGAWREHGIASDRVRARNQPIAAGSPTLWEFALSLIDEAVRRGYLPE